MKQSKTRKEKPPVVFPLLIALMLTVIAWLTPIDFILADFFFNEETGTWFLKNDLVVKLIYDLSPIPAFIIFGVSTIVVLGSIWKKIWRRGIRTALCWMLVMALGPGLVVNAVFKDWYGRPRPKHVEEYGGKMEFCPVWVIGVPGKAKSFPCGHASIGFYFMTGYFCYWRRNRRAARIWLAVGLIAGTIIGMARMANGAHWFSDVVWAGVFMYFISYLSATVCGLLKEQPETTA